MKLSDLIRMLEADTADGLYRTPSAEDASIEIGSIHCRAQEVLPGGLFVAIQGFAADGHDYIDTAIKKGAAAVVTQREMGPALPEIVVADSRRALSAIASFFYGQPDKSLFMIGITGTNGKTTTAYLVEAMLLEAGIKTGVISTVNYRHSGICADNPVTTPESLDLHRILAEMKTAGITHVVMEVSSHAIDLHRVDHCRFDIAVFTNLSQDHLDYHETMEAYWQCKKDWIITAVAGRRNPKDACVIINFYSSRADNLAEALRRTSPSAETIRILPPEQTAAEGKTIRPGDITSDLNGFRGHIVTWQGPFGVATSLTGQHNLENVMCAAAAAMSAGASLSAVQAGLNRMGKVPGRLEPVKDPQGRHIYVDYAHTPDALENVLTALSRIAFGRIVTVFGCGGDRDRGKRPIMGEIAGRLSDLVIITSDNPRTEDPLEIIRQIENGVRISTDLRISASELPSLAGGRGYLLEPDRRTAINLGVQATAPNDVLLVAGKGHETYQIIGKQTIAFDDVREVGRALSGIDGPAETAGNAGFPNKSQGPSAPYPWTAAELLKASGGRILCGDYGTRFQRLVIDSRQASHGDLFIAIRGEKHDGHSFCGSAAAQGVQGILINADSVAGLPVSEWQQQGLTCIVVDDTTAALGCLARFNRQRRNIPVVAITGSNGKTSTKSMVRAVLCTQYNTLTNKGNFNNEIGMPLTLFELGPRHEAAVLELGMNHPGEMDRLGAICRPDVALITNVGPVHLEGLGSVEGVARAKGELLKHVSQNGTVILNGDDPHVAGLPVPAGTTVLRFGLNAGADFRAENISENNDGIRFIIITPAGKLSAALKTPGRFMVHNALAAAAAGWTLGVSMENIVTGLETFILPKGRLNIFTTPGGIHVIDDTYNANPVSMKAAIDTLLSLKQKARGFFVAGDMFELGKHAPRLHREVGFAAGRSGICRLYAAGDNCSQVADGAVDASMNPEHIVTGTKDELLADIKGHLRPGDWVLVKGSRGMQMETVVAGLLEI